MTGGEDKKSHGYTIIEVMIFLAISGFMFILAIAFVSGKQAKSEFKQGTNDINQQVQTVINDVSNGFYPSNSNFSCSAGASGPPTFTNIATEQGQNGGHSSFGQGGCIFLGKVIQFSPQGSGGVGYNIFSVAGRQYMDGSNIVSTNLQQAAPTAIAAPKSPISLTENKTLEWGLSVTKTFYDGNNINCSPSQNLGSIAFFGSFGQYAGTDLQSGAQSVMVACVPGSSLNNSGTQTVNDITNITDTDVVSNSQFVICFAGGQNQRASLTIGSTNGQQLTTRLEAGGGVDSRC
ncbi:MAG TPA: prepilin-type N-terminal cleavage/methylation domain-containing protein [Candidatus Dormibacteraeota bacterium]|nr:prepilin-type N-terminal cleavage/methylation domain-containing protein [Candidatus Dormibacteraeota bacterium]